MKKAVLLLGTLAVASLGLAQTTKLRIFVGGQQRPDVVKKITDIYEKRNPGVKIEIEVGGATSDQQQQYLTTVLASRDPSIDAILIDVIRPASTRPPAGPTAWTVTCLGSRRPNCSSSTCRPTPRPTRSTVPCTPCPALPMPSSCFTARIWWPSTVFSPPRPGTT